MKQKAKGLVKMWLARRSCVLLALCFTIPMAARAAELTVPGTGDGLDILKAIGAVFTAENPEFPVNIPPSIGSGGGIAAVATGRAVIARIARPLSEAEQAQGLHAVLVFQIPSAIFANAASSTAELTSPQLREIFQGGIVNWQEVGGANVRIRVVRRENEDSTLNVLRASMPGWKDLVFTPKTKTAVTTQDMIQSVREVEGAIGFGPFTPTMQQGLVALKIDGLGPTDKKYPSYVQIALIYADASVTPEAKRFIEFIKSAKAAAIITNMGAAPIGD